MKLLIFLFILISFLLFFNLGTTKLTNWDEAWLASVSQDVVQRNNWLSGKFNEQIWFYEPPLVIWILAVIYKIFGPSEFWMRFPNAVCGFLTVVVVYKLSTLLTKSKISAYISCLILLSDIEFLFRSRQINVEILLTLLLFTSIYSLYYAKAKPSHYSMTTGLYLSYFLLGLAFLTKRASPLLALPAILVLSREYLQTHKKVLLLIVGLILFFVVLAPWFIYQYLYWKNQFIEEFFLKYTIGKILSSNQTNGVSILFYFSALRHAFKVWSLFIPPTLIWFILKIKKQKVFLPLLIYILTFFTALALAPIKSSWYLLPVHPAIAIFIGIFISDILNKFRVQKLGILAMFVIFALQIIKYRASYIVPNITRSQAQIALYAKTLTTPQDIVYLDDDYLPVAVFYSQRKIVPLRFDRLSRQNLPISSVEPGRLILSNSETINHLRQNIPNRLREIYQVSDLILLRSESN